MNKTILILLDGLNADTAATSMGFLGAQVESGRAHFHRVQSELPSLSRPLYECILTGVPPIASGIIHNDVTRRSREESIFSLARREGRTTAAAAYHWVSELYNRSPWQAGRDRFTDDDSLAIQHGIFYSADDYPDSHLFLDAEHLRRRHDPDFLFIHPMNIDYAGHCHGFDSADYRNAARMADICLSDFLGEWITTGYQILITADHGMNNDHSHGGLLECEREVPLFLIGDTFSGKPCEVRQTELCGLCCDLLGLTTDKPRNSALLA